MWCLLKPTLTNLTCSQKQGRETEGTQEGLRRGTESLAEYIFKTLGIVCLKLVS